MSSTSLTGFGDVADYTAFVHFRRVQPDPESGAYPDWEQEPITQTRHIPGSNRNDTFLSGFGPAVLTLTVWLDDRAAYRRLRAMYYQTATLRLRARFTSHDGPVQHLLDGDYEDFALTTLVGINQPRHRVDGPVEAVLTFQRGFDPVTGLGIS